VPEIDRQHQELAAMINGLDDAVKHHASAKTAVKLFDEMVAYARFHFETEERLMEQYEYIEDDAHKLGHQRLIGEANYLREKFIQGDELLVLQFLKDWLLPHILDMDKPLANFLIQHGYAKLISQKESDHL
jgi:hemerythrin-like metal-binding protein